MRIEAMLMEMDAGRATNRVSWHSLVLWLVAVVVLVSSACTYMCLHLFSTFSAYDDEGYFLVLVRHMLDGRRMYDDVSIPYGPAYLVYRWVLHGICGLPLDTDGIRITTMGVWCACSLLIAWMVRVLTKGSSFSPLIAVTAGGFAVVQLAAFGNEPGHPHELTQLLLLGGLAVFVVLRKTHARLAAFVLGLAIAATGLAKVNLGVFFGLPALLLFLSSDSTRGLRFLRWMLLGAALGLPWLLLRAHLSDASMIGLASVVSCGSLAAFIQRDRRDSGTAWRDLGFALAGIAIGTLLFLGFALARGSTVAGMVDSIVLWPAHISGMAIVGTPIPVWSIGVAFCSLFCAVWMRRSGNRLPAWVLPTAELAFALFVFWSIGRHTDHLIACALPFAWLVLVRDASTRALRMPLVLCAPLQALQIFPVSGSQLVMGSSLLVPLAALALSDACAAIAPAAAISGRRLTLAGVVAGSLTVFVAVTLIGRAREWRRYSGRDQVGLLGAQWTHFDESVGARARCLADTVTASSHTFLSVRGDNSQYGWAGTRPPTGVIVGNWWAVMQVDQEAELAAALAGTPRLLVLDTPVRDDGVRRDTQGIISDDLRASSVFFQTLRRSFRSMAVLGADTLCVRNEEPDSAFASCVLLPEADLGVQGARLSVRWPAHVEGPAIGRLQIISSSRGFAPMNSAGAAGGSRLCLWDGTTLLFDGTAAREVPLARVASASDLRLELETPLPPQRASAALVRFFDVGGQRILTLPVVIVLGAR